MSPRLLLVRIDARYHNGVVDVTPLDLAASEFTCAPARLAAADGAQLLRLDERSPRYAGERVRLRHVRYASAHRKGDGQRLREVLPYRHGLPLARLGTDLYAQTIYAPSGKHHSSVHGTWELDGLWKLRGLDGYIDGLCDLARIESIDATARVFTKRTSDGF